MCCQFRALVFMHTMHNIEIFYSYVQGVNRWNAHGTVQRKLWGPANIQESGVFMDISGLVHVRQFRRNRRSNNWTNNTKGTSNSYLIIWVSGRSAPKSWCPRVDASQAESTRPNVLSRCAPYCSQLPYSLQDWEAVYHTTVVAPQPLHTNLTRSPCILVSLVLVSLVLPLWFAAMCMHCLSTPVKVVVLTISQTICILRHTGTTTTDIMAPCGAR